MTSAVPEPDAVIRDLRHLALTAPPGDLGFAPSSTYPRVFGVVMDTGHSDALVTLVSLVDGTTSLYLGTGGAIIGAGAHEAVRHASLALLARAQRSSAQLVAVDEFPLPAIGEVRFYVRTYDGVRSAAAAEKELAAGTHDLAPLFIAAHVVIAAIRKQTDKSPGASE